MKILLVNPPARQPRQTTLMVPPLGLAYLAAVLRAAGYPVEVKDAFAEGLSWEAFADYLAARRPEILGLTGISPTIDTAFKAVRLARPYAQTIIMGGPHVSVWGQEVFKQCPELDLGVVGEGEDTVVELAAALARGTRRQAWPGSSARIFKAPGGPCAKT